MSAMDVKETRLKVTVIHDHNGYRSHVKVESVYPDSDVSFTTYADEITVEEVHVG